MAMLAAILLAIIAVTVGLGLVATRNHAELAHGLLIERTQAVLDRAVEDLVWGDYSPAVTALALEIAADARRPMATGDRTALAALLAGASRRGPVASGAIALRGLEVLDLDLVSWAATGSAIGRELPGAVATLLRSRRGDERLMAETIVWRNGQRPVLSVVAPLGGSPLAGYLLLHADLAPALHRLERRVGAELVVQGLDGATPLWTLDGFRHAPDAVTRPARLWLRGPAGAEDGTGPAIARIDGTIETTALSRALAEQRLGFVAAAVLFGTALAMTALNLVGRQLRRAEAVPETMATTGSEDRRLQLRRPAVAIEEELTDLAATVGITATRREAQAGELDRTTAVVAAKARGAGGAGTETSAGRPANADAGPAPAPWGKAMARPMHVVPGVARLATDRVASAGERQVG